MKENCGSVQINRNETVLLRDKTKRKTIMHFLISCNLLL